MSEEVANFLSSVSPPLPSRETQFLPALNTSMMDGRIQDVVLNHPLVRMLIIPECDLQARRSCLELITRVVDSAAPVLPLMLQDLADVYKNSELSNSKIKSILPKIPKLTPETLSQQTATVLELAERNSIVGYWIQHFFSHKGEKINSAVSNKNSSGHNQNGRSNSVSGSNSKTPSLTVSLALYSKIKRSRDILADLADRVQGAVSIVFWESWDEIYTTLALVVAPQELERCDSGRLFRPKGDAAIYRDKLKAAQKQQEEHLRRMSLLDQSALHIGGDGWQSFESGVGFGNGMNIASNLPAGNSHSNNRSNSSSSHSGNGIENNNNAANNSSQQSSPLDIIKHGSFSSESGHTRNSPPLNLDTTQHVMTPPSDVSPGHGNPVSSSSSWNSVPGAQELFTGVFDSSENFRPRSSNGSVSQVSAKHTSPAVDYSSELRKRIRLMEEEEDESPQFSEGLWA